MFQIDKLSTEGATITAETIAFNAFRAAAQKAGAAIRAEKRIAEAGGIDAYNNQKNTDREDDLAHENTTDQGNTPSVTFYEYCTLGGLANDYLETLANGGKWPRPQDVANVVEYLTKQTTGSPRNDEIEVMRAMVKADTGKDITDEDLLPMLKEQANQKAQFFAAQMAEIKDEVIDRINAGIVEARVKNFDLTLETAFANLPDNVRYTLLGAVDRKLDDKANELKSGQKRNGQASPVAKIPLINRVPMVAVLRDDQKQLKAARHDLAHAE